MSCRGLTITEGRHASRIRLSTLIRGPNNILAADPRTGENTGSKPR
jgi:hypothetical protein